MSLNHRQIRKSLGDERLPPGEELEYRGWASSRRPATFSHRSHEVESSVWSDWGLACLWLRRLYPPPLPLWSPRPQPTAIRPLPSAFPAPPSSSQARPFQPPDPVRQFRWRRKTHLTFFQGPGRRMRFAGTEWNPRACPCHGGSPSLLEPLGPMAQNTRSATTRRWVRPGRHRALHPQRQSVLCPSFSSCSQSSPSKSPSLF